MKLLIALLIAVVLFFVQDKIYAYLWDRHLKISLEFKHHIVDSGDQNVLIETIENQKWLPLPILQVKFAASKSFLFQKEEMAAVTDQYYRNEFFSILSYQRIVRELPFICSQRGCFSIKEIDVYAKDLFLTGKLIGHLPQDAMVTVLPRKIKVNQIPFSIDVLYGNVVKKSYVNEDPFEFVGIREYQPYDSLHSINWKNTAKSGMLQVNTYLTTYTQQVYIFLNLEANRLAHAEQIYEESIRVADAIAGRFLYEHIPVGFYTNGRDIFTGDAYGVTAGAGGNHVRNIEIALARIDLKQERLPFVRLLMDQVNELNTQAKILIVSNSRKTDIKEAFQQLCDRGYTCTWVVPEYYDMVVEESRNDPERILKWEIEYEH